MIAPSIKPAAAEPASQRVFGLKVFITGASTGIGQALARYYAGQGATLGLVARRGELLEQLAHNLGCHYAIYPLDVRDAKALDLAAQDFMQRYGVPNLVIANAGVSRGTLTECKEDMEAFKAVMDINVLGMVHTFQPFIKPMSEQIAQCIAQAQPYQFQLAGIASVAGIRGLPGSGAYSASKAAAISYLEALRIEMLKPGICVTTIAPGYIRTPMTDVNTYKMPFLMEADVAAEKFAAAIAAKKRFVIIPWQMSLLGRIIKLLPPSLWDSIMKRAPHKPRL